MGDIREGVEVLPDEAVIQEVVSRYTYVGRGRWERVVRRPGARLYVLTTRAVAWACGRDAVREAVAQIDATSRAAVLAELLRDAVTPTLRLEVVDGARWIVIGEARYHRPSADAVGALAFGLWRGDETREQAEERAEELIRDVWGQP